MADYSVNIALAIKGARELKQLRNDIKSASKSVDLLNRSARKLNLMEKSFNNMSKVVGKANAVINKAVVGTDQFNKAARVLVKTESEYNKMLRQKQITLGTIQLQEDGMNMTQKERLNLINQIGKENVKNMQVAQMTLRIERQRNMAAKARRGLSSAVGSGIIGGGFPLLFGQGPISALGGAAGGVAGGALSAIPGMGQFGFALSIAGTAIGSAMEDLSEAMRKPEDNIENLIGKLGLVGTPTEKMAKELEKLGLKGSAARLVLDKFNEKMGQSPDVLKENSEKLIEFKNKINELGTAITLFLGKALVPFINTVMGAMTQGQLLKALEAQEGPNFSKAQQSIVNQSQKEAQRLFKTTNQGQDIGKTYNQIFDERLTFNLKKAVGSPDATPNLLQGGTPSTDPTQDFIDKTKFNKEILPLQQALEIEQKRLNTSSEKLALMQEQFKLINLENELELLKLDNKGTENDLHGDTIKKLENQINLQEAVVANAEALVDPMRKVTEMIVQDMGNGIKELIKGTKTLNDVMINMLNKMAEVALNQAIFGNISGTFERGGGGILGSIFKANGGPVKGGNSYIVGERGAELFTPGVSGMITPNNALGGSVNVSVNVDASGTSTEGDGASGEQLGRLIGAAVQAELIKEKRPGGLLG